MVSSLILNMKNMLANAVIVSSFRIAEPVRMWVYRLSGKLDCVSGSNFCARARGVAVEVRVDAENHRNILGKLVRYFSATTF